jgi:microcystin-dependent protein
MSDQFLGEIRAVGFNFAPYGWALCAGQILSISQNAALFSLLGTNFGGNGTSTFALPNLQNVSPMDQGSGIGLTPRTIGETGGEANVTLLTSQIPSHSHVARAGTPSGIGVPAPNTTFGDGGRGKPQIYAPGTSNLVTMNPSAVGLAGSSLPHNNLPPYTTINYVIALQGIYPARS